jgi:hypothetical protein
VCFCKPILQICYKIQSIQLDIATHRIVSSHACAFVSPSCKYVTKYKASNSREQRIASCHLISCVCFCKPILQICYKIQSIQLEREQRITSCHLMRCVCSSRRQLTPNFGRISISANSFVHPSKIFVVSRATCN